MHKQTEWVQIGKNRDPETGAVSFPVYHSTVYQHPGAGESTGFDYARTKNPTRSVLEEAIARLERGVAGFACSSGMAAIQTAMGLFSQGDHLIVSLDLYGGTYRLFEEVLSRYGLSFSYVDFQDPKAVERAATSRTKGIFIETPTNPLMQVTDLSKICHIARKNGWISLVDNTFMTPYFQQPLLLGADVVIHSATKYLGGHNDVLAGLIVTGERDLAEKVASLHNGIGAVLGPQDSWLLIRGMKTLALRMEKHQENAGRIVQYLKQHPGVEEVFYPSLLPQSRKIQDVQASGYGGMLSFRVKKAEMVNPFLSSLQLISYAESLGGVESLLTHPATQTHAEIPEEIRKRVGVCDRLLRMSVGIEHPEDLIHDLAQALDRSLSNITRRG
ncbi:aminotransferase class I/II-fold pyridoxal phosphate-dependent enzyme [Melghirimyces algeriensis]|uniref:Cystathionine gamma-synthase n=1 Tax=Melghirimyces algeriensis TaxID=910412 RepID=A0A521BUM0_9BACL|nr:aminotransferase class I/II-fold pyridoxal phosphate-dependent enzyme [Melghirimyces algeriensis]SMO50848.1 cystathionine gamma-synthase [Melghirimyces algeriensis]